MHSPAHSPLKEKKYIVRKLVRLLNNLSLATCFGINWNEFAAYWQSPFRAKPTWLNIFKWKWAQERDLPKLFETAFGLSLNTWDVDNFLKNKIQRREDIGIEVSFTGGKKANSQPSLSTLDYIGNIWDFENDQPLQAVEIA